MLGDCVDGGTLFPVRKGTWMNQQEQKERGKGIGCLGWTLVCVICFAVEVLALCLGSAWMVKRFFL